MSVATVMNGWIEEEAIDEFERMTCECGVVAVGVNMESSVNYRVTTWEISSLAPRGSQT